MSPRFLLAPIVAAVAGCQPLLETPRLGCWAGPAGAVHEVLGLKAALITREARAAGARNAVCGSRLSILHVESGLAALDGKGMEIARLEVSDPAVLLSIARDEEKAAVFLISTRRWFGLRNRQWEPLPIEVDGEILAIAAGPGGAIAVAVRRDGRLWLVHIDGNTGMRTTEEPAGAAAAQVFVWPDGALLLAGEEGVAFQPRHGAQGSVVFARPAARLAAMSESGVLVTLSEGGQYGLFREGAQISVFAIPGGGP